MNYSYFFWNFFYTFFSIEDSKYFEFESNSNIVSNLSKTLEIIIAFIKKFFSSLRCKKTLWLSKIFFFIITIEDLEDFKLNSILLHILSSKFKNFKNNYPCTKNFFHHQRFNKMTLPFIRFPYLSFHREKNNSFARRNLFIIQLIPPSCRFSLTFRGTRIIYVSSGHGPFFPFIERTLIKFLQFSRRTKGQFTRFSCSWPNGCN